MRRSVFIIMLLFVFTITSGVVFSQEKGGGKDRASKDRGKGKGSNEPKSPFAGDIAPTFKLMSMDGKREVDLEKIKGKKPIALFFGSYT